MLATLRLLQSATPQVFKSLKVPVVVPGQPEYDRSIAVSNRLYRFSRPDCVVLPESAEHVQRIIREARSGDIVLTIKCNGHSYAGHSTAFKGVSLDLRRMNKATLDMDTKIVTMDAGCQWGHVYQTLINGRHNGYVINGGRCPTVGVGGFILGGGLGPFTRSFGMGCDTLAEATVVTADGDLVTIKDNDARDTKEGKLFWALCGAGGGNFGVVVQMKLKVQKLKSPDKTVVSGRYQWAPEGGLTDQNLAVMNDFYTTNWPNNLTIDSTWICAPRKDDTIRFTMVFDGGRKRYERILDQNIKDNGLKKELKRRALPEKSTRFLYETLVNQWLEETERAYHTNKTYELFSSFVFKNDNKEDIQKITKIIRDLMTEFRKDFKEDDVCLMATWIHSGGKATEKNPTETAFFWREAVYHTYITVEWTDKWMEKSMREVLRKVKDALRPFSINGEAAFINFPDRDFSPNSHEKMYFGNNWEELRRVKEMWDKDKFFNFIHGIKRPDDPEDVVAEYEDQTDKLASQQWESYNSVEFSERLEYLRAAGY